MVGWLFGALLAAGFASLGAKQIIVVVSERGPTTLSCHELLESGTHARWVDLSGCVARWERARSFADGRLQRGRYVPLEPVEGSSASATLLARIDAYSSRRESVWRGLLDVRAAEDRPPFADASTRILYVGRPNLLEIALSIGAPVLYVFAAGVGLRWRSRRRAALKHLVARFPHRVAVSPPGLQVLDLDPLLRAGRTIRRAWPVILAALGLLLSVAAASLLETGTLPVAVSLATIAAPVVAVLVTRWLSRRVPTDRRLALMCALSVSLAILLVLAMMVPGAPAAMAMSVSFVPALVVLTFVLARGRRRLLLHPDWVTLADVDGGVTTVSAKQPPRHESLRRRPIRITLYRTAAVATAAFGLLAAAALRLSPVLWVGGGISLVFWRRAQRHASLDAREVRERDPRAPVMLLRSFADDEIELRGLPEFLWSRPTTLTWVAAERLATVGPVVAVGEPGEGLPPLGPYRLFLPPTDWREEVDKLISTASAVYIVPGRSPGVRWEFQRILQRQSPGRVTLIFPPAAPDDLERRWEDLLALTRDLPAWHRIEHLDPMTFLLFRPLHGDAALAICATRPDGRAYALAFSVCAAIDTGSMSPGSALMRYVR